MGVECTQKFNVFHRNVRNVGKRQKPRPKGKQNKIESRYRVDLPTRVDAVKIK